MACQLQRRHSDGGEDRLRRPIRRRCSHHHFVIIYPF
jgi:hypothetical protein